MKRFMIVAITASHMSFAAEAEIPREMNHQGVVSVDGVRFNGV